MVDFHGAHRPAKLRRAYSTELVREGVLGFEYSKIGYKADPDHEVTLPFTRMLAGPMDYTPGGFHDPTRAEFQPQMIEVSCQKTRPHQLERYVVYEMPLATVADHLEVYKNQPEFEFIEKVPTVWDDTKVLNGEPGSYVTVTRQHGEAWYIVSTTHWDTRDLVLLRAFLGQREYEVGIFADGSDADIVATTVRISKKRVRRTDKLNVHLASGGGLVVILMPANR